MTSQKVVVLSFIPASKLSLFAAQSRPVLHSIPPSLQRTTAGSGTHKDHTQ